MSYSQENVPPVIQEIAAQLPSEYSVVEFLGEGAHGIVLKARHKTLQHFVALKIIKTDGSSDMQKQILRMQNEAKVLARLSHQNIVQIYQMGACSDGTPFLVCEYIEGVTLAQILATEETLSPRKVLEIFTQILDALDCAHLNGLLHRDLKPGNVMIIVDQETGSLHVKLLDFGIARELSSGEAKLNLTRTIQLSGSAPYMSPEQCRGGKLDARSDLYSVACMLYECLCGTPPFVGETPMHTRYLQIHQQATLPSAGKFENTGSRAAVFALTLQALAKDMDSRPESARLFKSSLIESLPGAAKRNAWTSKTHKRGTFLATTLFLCIVAAGAYFVHSKDVSMKISVASVKTKPSLRHQSPKQQLAQLILQKEKFVYTGYADCNEKALRLRHDILETLKKISPKERGILYMGYRTVASIETRLGLQDNEATWKKALSFCKLSNGEYTVEASDCYDNLSEIYLGRREYDKAQSMIGTGIKHVRLREKKIVNFDLPTLLDFRTGLHYLPMLRRRAELESIRGETSKVLADLCELEECEFRDGNLDLAIMDEGAIISLWTQFGQTSKIKPFLQRRIEGIDLTNRADANNKAKAFLLIQRHLVDFPDLKKNAQELHRHYKL